MIIENITEMIIPNMSEQRVLEELIYDKKEVANEAKKIAKEAILRQQRAGRDNMDDNIYYESAITTTKNNNRWKLTVIVNMVKNPKWYHRAVCYCESGHGGMDYYYVRGFSNNAKPYFIRISSHALKRLKERWLERVANEKVEYSGGDFAPLVIQRGEVITWMKVSDFRLMNAAFHGENSHLLTTMFCTSHGFYLGYETELGNYEFRTYLGWERNLKKKGEDEAQYICHESYLMLNASLMGRTDKDILDMYGFTLDRDNYPFRLLP